MSNKSGQWSVFSGQSKLRTLYLPFSLILLSCVFFSLTTDHLPLTNSYNPVCKIPFEGGSFTTDNLQNVYVFHGSSIRKYSPQGKMLYNYSDKSFGAITSVDVNDPLKMLVFYKDFPKVVLLDNTLSVNGNPFSPADVGYPLTTLVCTSHDNGVWMYLMPKISNSFNWM